MEYRSLGTTGIKVSRLCFGALTIGPLQANLPVDEGARVLGEALDRGVNFIDTAELYRTYPYIKKAVRGRKNDVVIASKSYAYTYEGMEKSLQVAMKELDRDYLDIFLLHEQESALTLRGHTRALEYLLKAKGKGLVRAIGVSTHHIQCVRDVTWLPEIDVIHPLFNIEGIGIKDGGAPEMLSAIQEASFAGKGIYAMKALGGGTLSRPVEEALQYVLSCREMSSVAVGMRTLDEVRLNAAFFSGETIPGGIREAVKKQKRYLVAEEGCIGCASCVKACPQDALTLTLSGPVVDEERCLLCGYCGAACPEFCLKIV